MTGCDARGMAQVFWVGWNELQRAFVITSDGAAASLPTLPHHLDADLDAWEQHLRDHFTPERRDDLWAGQWSSEEARWWFVTEAGRIERELAQAVNVSRGVIKVSAFPGVIPVQFSNDYSSWPLWTIEGHTGPEYFPSLSESLRDDLVEWCHHHETGDAGTPGHTELLGRLRAELGPLYEVT